MSSITYFSSVYGTAPWASIKLVWAGTATTWRVYSGNNPTPIYTGTGTNYTFTGIPNQRYDFHLEGDLLGVTSVSQITCFTRSLPAPSNVVYNVGTHTLSWDAVATADTYEIADVTDSYAILHSTASTSQSMTVTAGTRYSVAVRTVADGQYSTWSAPITFTTPAPSTVVAAQYGIVPIATHVWQAGRSGSTDPGWRPTADDWFHGDGLVWGDLAGVQSTYFFYTGTNFTDLAGATVTAFEVYLERGGGDGDPGAVLSRWMLHSHATKPAGEPTLTGVNHDNGTFTRGQSGWVTLPNAWANALIAGTAKGIAWGGVSERYQVARKSAVAPFTGCLRITVS
jgi:hypothetical protein